MPKKRASKKKKSSESHAHLGARVTRYKLDIDAGINLDLKSGGLRYPEPDDPIYTYRTTITLYGEGSSRTSGPGRFMTSSSWVTPARPGTV